MPKVSAYEYGVLVFSVDMYRFKCAGGAFLGEDFTDPVLYEIFNHLAESGWEPHLYYQDLGNPAWVMRRAAETKQLPPEEQKDWRPVKYGQQEDDDKD